MKRTYFQTNILFQILCFVIFSVFVNIQYTVIKLIIEDMEKDLIAYISGEILASYFLFTVIRLEHNNIHIKNNKIFIHDDWTMKIGKIQFYAEVCVEEIESIDIIFTPKNSLLKSIDGNYPSDHVDKTYISFKTNNGRCVNMLVLYMSRKTIAKLLDDIKKTMLYYNNYTKIEETSVLIDKITNELFPKRKKKRKKK